MLFRSTYYQAVAQNGVAFCQAPGKLVQCKDNVGGAPAADAMVLIDAHPGNPVNALRSLNGAVTDESQPYKIDPTLDPYNPANGFNPAGESKYSPEFVKRYFEAQSARMNRLIDKALQNRAEMAAGKHFPADDDVLVYYRNRARLAEVQTLIHCCTEKPRRIILNDGTIEDGKIVHSVRLPAPDNAKRDLGFDDVRPLTIKSFLSANATRSTNADTGIDWCSTNNSTPCAVRTITVPMLVVAMGAHYFIRDNELIFEEAKSADKEYIVVEGAEHGMTPCQPCAKAQGKSYDNATKNLFDYVAKWLNARF